MAGLVLLGLALLSFDRSIPMFRSDGALWAAAVRVAPRSPRAWVNYGVALSDDGWNAQAFAAWTRADALSQRRWDRARVHRIVTLNCGGRCAGIS